jgi:hypothetical protein
MLAQRAEIVVAATAALDAGGIGSPAALSRQRRWRLLFLDARGDLAAVAVARRGKRSGLVVEAHHFRRGEGAWVWDQVGPTLDFTQPTLPPRATSAHGGHSMGTTQNDVRAGDIVGLWHLVAEATQIRTDGRLRSVPSHGWVVTVAPTSGCSTEVLDANDTVIGELRIEDPRRFPRRLRAARWWKRRGHLDRDVWAIDEPGRRSR